jgi:hypothetical protein
MIQRLGENIRVAAVFGPGNRLRPVWFDWNRKKHTVTEVSYTWKDKVGDVTLLHFAVRDGTALYELTYNTASQMWALSAVDAEQG